MHVDLVFADELPKCPPILLSALSCFSDVALISNQEFLNIVSLKFVDYIRLGFLERRFVRWGLLFLR